ncbi:MULTISPECIES: pre-peptidase C-terminal domain-containing protein [unclassified Pseudoalteromonas]|uniref:pre-peptidase C-terminal domain-containing protein n=1 Tax=unclassified Pseudoalteromonas TaxID=194690 RepID=UPI000694F337|nr:MULTISPECIES: pre-peptidase C-terminal domain-containing protein [unclassified Pseudoalteromonas]
MNIKNTIITSFKAVFLKLSLMILACALSYNVHANISELIKVEIPPLTKRDIIYNHDEMLNFNIKNYLNSNAPHLNQYAEIISHHAGRTSISPQLIMSLIEFKTQLISSFNSGKYIDKPFGLLSNKVGFSQQVEDITTKLNTLLFSSTVSTSRQNKITDAHAKIAIQSLLSLSPESLDAKRIIEIKSVLFSSYKNAFPIMAVSDVVSTDVPNLPPVDLLQFPFPVGESWHVGGTHSYEAAIDYSNGGGWGSDVSHLWVSASAPGTVIIHSSCSIEVIHDGGWSTSYYHVDNIRNQNHDRVERNQAIANYANNSAQALCQGGWSGGPHAHVTLKKNGTPFSLNGVTLSGYKVHAGNSDYDTNCNNYWLEKNGQKFCSAWFTNPGVGSVEPIEVITLINNQITNNLIATKGQLKYYKIDLPTNIKSFKVKTSGGTGNVDIFVNKGAIASEQHHNCKAKNINNNDECTITTPEQASWYVTLSATTKYENVSLQISYNEVVEPIVTNLINNQLLNNLTADKNESRLFKIAIPENARNLSVKLFGGSGDVDLYLRKAVTPTEKLYDCRSYNNANTENCLISEPTSDTWYILLLAYKAYNGVSIEVNYIEKEAEQVVVPLSKGQVISDLSASKNESKHFKINIPIGATNFTVNTIGSSGDVDIYLAKNMIATSSIKTTECSYGTGSQEQCLISKPSEGDWYILLHAYNAYKNVTLQASYSPHSETTDSKLSNNEIKSGISLDTAKLSYYTIEVPIDAKNLTISTFGGSGDADLYIKHASNPTITNYKCRSNSDGNSETCVVDNPSVGVWFIMLKAYSRFSDLNLQAKYTTSMNNTSGSLMKNNISILVGRWQYYAVNIPEDMSYFSVRTSDGTGNADLYLRKENKPTYTQNICRSNGSDNTENCNISTPSAGVWYIGIFAYGSSASGVNLHATWE